MPPHLNLYSRERVGLSEGFKARLISESFWMTENLQMRVHSLVYSVCFLVVCEIHAVISTSL